MSVASNDAFEDSREELGMEAFGSNSSDVPSIDETTGLPAAFSSEIIPRLDRLIQLMEALLNRSAEPPKPSAVVPTTTTRNTGREMDKLKKEKIAAGRRSQSIKAKAKSTFFKNTGTKDHRSHGQTTRERYNAAQRKRSNKSIPCWTEKNRYEEDDSYRVGAVWPTAISW